MRVLLLTASYRPVIGGLQTVTEDVATGLQGLGHNVLVVTERYPRRLKRSEEVRGVRVERLQFLRPTASSLARGRPDLWLRGVVLGPLTELRLRRLAREFRPDVLNVHFPNSQILFALRLRRTLGCRLVVSLHGAEVEMAATSPEARRPFAEILREADSVTACSKWLLERAIEIVPSIATKSVVIHNGFEMARILPEPERLDDLSEVPPFFLVAARLVRKKGVDLAIEAFGRVNDAAHPHHLVVVGNGPEDERLRKLTRVLDLRGKVSFRGGLPRRDVLSLMAKARAVIIPSRLEPFGLVVLEGLAAGNAVLTTNVGGIPEILDVVQKEVGGRWCRVGEGAFLDRRLGAVMCMAQRESLADGIRVLSRNKLPMALNGNEVMTRRGAVARLFSVERMVANYLQVLGGV